MTQDLGDAGAQQVVGAHNRIVRESLSKFQGNEIKHTGDGSVLIMHHSLLRPPQRGKLIQLPIQKTCRCILKSSLILANRLQKITIYLGRQFSWQQELLIKHKKNKFLFLIRSMGIVRVRRCSLSNVASLKWRGLMVDLISRKLSGVKKS